jgi:hypothetical protein
MCAGDATRWGGRGSRSARSKMLAESNSCGNQLIPLALSILHHRLAQFTFITQPPLTSLLIHLSSTAYTTRKFLHKNGISRCKNTRNCDISQQVPYRQCVCSQVLEPNASPCLNGPTTFLVEGDLGFVVSLFNIRRRKNLALRGEMATEFTHQDLQLRKPSLHLPVPHQVRLIRAGDR